MKKVKSQIVGAIKPANLFGKPAANNDNKSKATEESKDTLDTSNSNSRPSTTTRKSNVGGGLKQPG